MSERQKRQLYTPAMRMKLGYMCSLPFTAPLILMWLFVASIHPNGFQGLYVLLPGLLLIALGGYFSLAVWGFRLSKGLRVRLEPKVEADFSLSFKDAPMVGISPGRENRLYHGNTCCDIGFLLIEPGRMSYYGDTTSFELRPDQVTRVGINQMNIFGGRYTRVIVTWKENPHSDEEDFTIECWDASSLRDLNGRANDLKDRLERWRIQDGSPAPLTVEELGLPPTLKDVRGMTAPSAYQAGCVSVFLAGVFAFSLWIGLILAAEPILGEKAAKSPVMPVVGVLVAVAAFAVLSRVLRKRIG